MEIKNRLRKLKSTVAVSEANQPKVEFSLASEDLKFPLVAQASNFGIHLKSWMKMNEDSFNSKLKQTGALLFRGFGIDTVDKFQDLIKYFVDKPLEYKMRSSPRYAVGDNVYHTTTYPNELKIKMHSESSYDPNHPDNIVFCSILPAEEGGETPIADNRLVLSNLSEATRKKFREKGVKYVRNLTNSLGLPWQEVFQTSDRMEVEKICFEKGINCQWKSEEHLTLDWNKKAIWEHPVTGEWVWFNHAYFFNKYSYEKEFLAMASSDDDLPNNTYYGDGTEISEAEIKEIELAYQKSTYEFQWRKGDVLFLDNMLMSHGRNSFKGERKTIASIF